MALSEEENRTQIVADLNCLARLAALEKAWESRKTAVHMAELYRYRGKRKGEPVELSSELRAVELYLRLVNPRSGKNCSWEFHSKRFESVMVPRGELLDQVEESVIRCLDRDEEFCIHMKAVAKGANCVISMSVEPGEEKTIRMYYPL